MPASYEKVTRIEDLPDLDQLDNPISQAQPMVSRQRGIRTTDRIGNSPRESGMSHYNQPVPDVYQPEDPYATGYDLQFDEDLGKNYRPKPVPTYEPYEKGQKCAKDCNCVFIYDHVKECDICKRFYKPDITPYLVIILILIIACAMMAKKLFSF